MVTDTTPFTVSLDWEEPATPNGIIDNYIIRYYETSSPGSITLYNDSIQETSAVVYNLMAFTSYTFRVSGVTVDEGPFAEISATTNESSTYIEYTGTIGALYVARNSHLWNL